jgi:hypothetical protein
VLIILNSVSTYPLILQPIINAAQNSCEPYVQVNRKYLRAAIALSLNVLVFIVSVLIPSFQTIMSVLGILNF